MIALLLLAIGVALLYIFYRWATVNNEYFKQRNIPNIPPTLLLGNTGAFLFARYRPNEYVQKLYNAFPDHK